MKTANITVAQAYELLKNDMRVHNRVMSIGEEEVIIQRDCGVTFDAFKDYLVDSINYTDNTAGVNTPGITGVYEVDLKMHYARKYDA